MAAQSRLEEEMKSAFKYYPPFFLLRNDNEITGGQELRGLAAAKYSSVQNQQSLNIIVHFSSQEYPKSDSLRPMPDVVYPSIYIDRIVVSDFYGNV